MENKTPYPWLEDYLLSLPGAEHDYKLEWQWDRYMIRGKMFAATMCPGAEHDPAYAGHPIVNLKCDPRRSELLRAEFPFILPGFYADKKAWISVLLDSGCSEDLLRELCADSHRLVLEKLPKYVQKEIAGE